MAKIKILKQIGDFMKKAKSKAQKIIGREMEHFEKKELHSGKSGKIVTDPKQAIAISLQMARKAGAKIPKKKAK